MSAATFCLFLPLLAGLLEGVCVLAIVPDDQAVLDKIANLSLTANYSAGCDVPQVSCSADLQRIIELRLQNNQLSGPIPDLSALTQLTQLRLHNNQLSGPIPDLSALTQLTHLHLSTNQLSGPIPDLSALTQLTQLYLENNQLSGPIPDLSALTQLTQLYLENNQLSGPIPDLSALTQLTQLRLHTNQLSGPIPDLSALTQLTQLHLSTNQLSGPIPDLSALTLLTLFLLKNNTLEGPLALTDPLRTSMPLFTVDNVCGQDEVAGTCLLCNAANGTFYETCMKDCPIGDGWHGLAPSCDRDGYYTTWNSATNTWQATAFVCTRPTTGVTGLTFSGEMLSAPIFAVTLGCDTGYGDGGSPPTATVCSSPGDYSVTNTCTANTCICPNGTPTSTPASDATDATTIANTRCDTAGVDCSACNAGFVLDSAAAPGSQSCIACFDFSGITSLTGGSTTSCTACTNSLQTGCTANTATCARGYHTYDAATGTCSGCSQGCSTCTASGLDYHATSGSAACSACGEGAGAGLNVAGVACVTSCGPGETMDITASPHQCQISSTGAPTASPTAGPTLTPTSGPTTSPTSSPTTSPTSSPTASPTPAPTLGDVSNPSADHDSNGTPNYRDPDLPGFLDADPVDGVHDLWLPPATMADPVHLVAKHLPSATITASFSGMVVLPVTVDDFGLVEEGAGACDLLGIEPVLPGENWEYATEFELTLEVEDNTKCRVSLLGERAKDLAGSFFPPQLVAVLDADSTAPLVTLTSSVSASTSLKMFPLTVTMSEAPVGFDVSDIVPSNAGIDSFFGSGNAYTMNVSPITSGRVRITVPAAAIADEAANTNAEAFFEVTYQQSGGKGAKARNGEGAGNFFEVTAGLGIPIWALILIILAVIILAVAGFVWWKRRQQARDKGSASSIKTYQVKSSRSRVLFDNGEAGETNVESISLVGVKAKEAEGGVALQVP